MLEKKVCCKLLKDKCNIKYFYEKIKIDGMTTVKHADKLNSYSKEDKSLAALVHLHMHKNFRNR